MATFGEVTITGQVSSGNGEVWIALVSITGGGHFDVARLHGCATGGRER